MNILSAARHYGCALGSMQALPIFLSASLIASGLTAIALKTHRISLNHAPLFFTNTFFVQSIIARIIGYPFSLTVPLSLVGVVMGIFWKIMQSENLFSVKTYDVNKDVKEQIPCLCKRREELTNQIAAIERFVNERPDLKSACEKAWQDFVPHIVKTSSPSADIDPLDPVDQAYVLEMEIRNKERILENYQYFIKLNPQIEATISRILHYNPSASIFNIC